MSSQHSSLSSKKSFSFHQVLASLSIPKTMGMPQLTSEGLVAARPGPFETSRLESRHADASLTSVVGNKLSEIVRGGVRDGIFNPEADEETAKQAEAALNGFLAQFLSSVLSPHRGLRTDTRQQRLSQPNPPPAPSSGPPGLHVAIQAPLVQLFTDMIRDVVWRGDSDSPAGPRSRLFLRYAVQTLPLVAQSPEQVRAAVAALGRRLNRALGEVSRFFPHLDFTLQLPRISNHDSMQYIL